MEAWIVRGGGRNRITGTHLAHWVSVPQHVVLIILTGTWVWEAYRRFKILATLSCIRAVFGFYSKPRQRQPVPVCVLHPRGTSINR